MMASSCATTEVNALAVENLTRETEYDALVRARNARARLASVPSCRSARAPPRAQLGCQDRCIRVGRARIWSSRASWMRPSLRCEDT